LAAITSNFQISWTEAKAMPLSDLKALYEIAVRMAEESSSTDG